MVALQVLVRGIAAGGHGLDPRVDTKYGRSCRWSDQDILRWLDFDARWRLRMKPFETAAHEIQHPLDAAIVVEYVCRSIGPDHIKTLRGLALIAPRVHLSNRLHEPLRRVGLSVLQLVSVSGKGNEALELLDDLVVGKEEPPVPESVVSRAAHGVAVHDPHEDRLAFLLSVEPRLG